MASRFLYPDRKELMARFEIKAEKLGIKLLVEALEKALISRAEWQAIPTKGMTLKTRIKMLDFIGEEYNPATTQPVYEQIAFNDTDEERKQVEKRIEENKRKNIANLKGKVPHKKLTEERVINTINVLYFSLGWSSVQISELFECTPSNIAQNLNKIADENNYWEVLEK